MPTYGSRIMFEDGVSLKKDIHLFDAQNDDEARDFVLNSDGKRLGPKNQSVQFDRGYLYRVSPGQILN